MTKEDKIFYQEKILEKIENLIQDVFDDKGLVLDKSMGEDTVCTVCNMLEKVCEKYPEYRCADALKGNTKLDELEKALQRIKDGSFGVCSVCGKNIPKQQLLKALTLSVCKECSSQLLKKK
jgi:DnaK suppressor protein